MKVGIFGGTFDPIHYGHLVIAQTAVNEIPLDKVIFVPAGTPPHKIGHPISPANIRQQLVELAIEGNPRFSSSAVELQREGPSFMVDTLAQLKSLPEYAGCEFFLIIGADNLLTFLSWRKPHQILKNCRLAVYPRYEADLDLADPALIQQALVFKAPRMEISSSYIRNLVRHNKSIQYLVPAKVEAFIHEHSLYRK
ncbi:MAG: nicotinate (nicotinamide) nucleotide adenylyltransferase [Calditrichaeota bacterium]|nr:MAG: nicotinate (nicotinamide) nucleotide adenylyltransferase [Calditrichota bacterium]